MTARPLDDPVSRPLRHSLADDAFGLLSGTFVASFGLYLL